MSQQTPAVAGTPAPGGQAQELSLSALQHRRELLADQYETAMRSRGQIGQERLNAQARGDASMVREYDGTVERLGARMQEIERSIAGVDRQIDEALKTTDATDAAQPLTPGTPFPVAIADGPSPADLQSTANAVQSMAIQYQRFMVAEGVGFLLLAALAWRFGLVRGRRQAPRVEALRDDTKLQQSIDAIAIEVERLSEGQRFVNNLMSARRPERETLPVQPPPLTTSGESSWVTPH